MTLLDHTENQFGQLDVLLNIAGMFPAWRWRT